RREKARAPPGGPTSWPPGTRPPKAAPRGGAPSIPPPARPRPRGARAAPPAGAPPTPPSRPGDPTAGPPPATAPRPLRPAVLSPKKGSRRGGGLREYAIPRAVDLPLPIVELNEIAEPDNPLGVKGAGENATTGAPAAVMNAIRDALFDAGVHHVDMPATAQQLWQALRAAASRPSATG